MKKLFVAFAVSVFLRLDGAVEKGFYAADNVPVERGSIEIWVTPAAQGCEAGDQVYFADADGWMREGTPTIWYWEQYVRFDVDSGKRIVYGRIPEGIMEEGVPVQIVACWDSSKGFVAIYANGACVQKREVEPWKAVKLSRYSVGQAGNSSRKAHASVDSLAFFNEPLAAGEVARRFGAYPSGIKKKASPVYRMPPLPPPPASPPEWIRFCEIDPAVEEPAATLGGTRVFETPCGRFRETSNEFDPRFPYKHDRFAYVRELPSTGLLVRVTAVYPDDKNRTLMFSQTQPDWGRVGSAGLEQQVLGSGIMTGNEFPNGNKPLTYSYVFRHPSKWLGLVVESPQLSAPAAIGRITVDIAKDASGRYSPAADKPVLPARNRRRAGLYWEDPVFSMCFGGTGGTSPAKYDADICRGMDYFSWCGHDLCFYPTVWYNGPIYKSRVQKGSWPNGMRHHPADFPRILAHRCSERGVKFVAGFSMYKLPSLEKRLGTTEEVIAGKGEYLNTVYANGEVSVTGRMYKAPLYNALHPDVREALASLVDEHCDMLRDCRSFGGVSLLLNMWNLAQCGLWLDTSYDDWTMGEFASFAGETPPGVPGTKERFSQRAKWISDNPARKEAFVKWRAKIMTDFYMSLATRLSSRVPGAKLYLRLESPSIALMNTSAGAFYKPYTGSSALEMGLDIERLAKCDTIVLDRMFSWGIVRCERNYHSDDKLTHPFADLEKTFQKEFLGSVKAATVHQFYFETHGEFSRKRTLQMPKPWTKEALGRCTAPLYPGRWALLYYARALELFDVKELSIGGYTLGTHGIEDMVREWTRAFQSLPDADFKKTRRDGSVLVRYANAEGSKWAYVLNVSPDEAVVSPGFPGWRDAVTGEDAPSKPFAIEGFGLRAFRMK